MNESIFDWERATIGTIDDIARIHKKALSGTLPSPALAGQDLEKRFQKSILEEDIQNGNRVFVLLEKNKSQIQAIIELFHAERYPGLYYSKTPLQWGRSINPILPDILKMWSTPCREVAIPMYTPEKRAPSRYMKKPFETLGGEIIMMYAADIR